MNECRYEVKVSILKTTSVIHSSFRRYTQTHDTSIFGGVLLKISSKSQLMLLTNKRSSVFFIAQQGLVNLLGQT